MFHIKKEEFLKVVKLLNVSHQSLSLEDGTSCRASRGKSSEHFYMIGLLNSKGIIDNGGGRPTES